MYTTCLFCNRLLEANEVIEHFPVGRRLAFDASKGRLWVVCRKCERWNLTPLHERWEAIEECERAFGSTRLRMSTDNIGLAKLKEGLELVRIGVPMRPEFAAWRYGDQFGRRRKRAIVWTVAGTAAVGAVAVGAMAAGVSAAILPQIPSLILNARTRLKIKTDDGRVLKVRRPELMKARMLPGGHDESWSLYLKHSRGEATFDGEEAVRITGLLLPQLNVMAGSKRVIAEAVTAIEDAGHPEAYLATLPGMIRRAEGPEPFYGRPLFPGKPGLVHKLPTPTKLAMEMALHEEQERVALAGELLTLEEAWREAEEVAAIADDLLVPKEVEEFIERHRPEDAGA
jgi:hypothetical protein